MERIEKYLYWNLKKTVTCRINWILSFKFHPHSYTNERIFLPSELNISYRSEYLLRTEYTFILFQRCGLILVWTWLIRILLIILIAEDAIRFNWLFNKFIRHRELCFIPIKKCLIVTPCLSRHSWDKYGCICIL